MELCFINMVLYVCWYCGFHSDRMIEFRYYKPSGGMSYKMFQCPDCKHIYKKATMKLNFSVRDWCKYIYLGILLFKKDDFYSRIKWEFLFINLKNMGLDVVFWDTWKEVKLEYGGMERLDDKNLIGEWYSMIEKAENKPKQLKLDRVMVNHG